MASEIEELRRQLEEEKAKSADLRIRLQKCRGALFVFRHPEDGNKPIEEWRWNPESRMDLQRLYDLPKLLAETRPEDATGIDILERMRSMRAVLEVLDRFFDEWTKDEHHDEEIQGMLDEPAMVVKEVLHGLG